MNINPRLNNYLLLLKSLILKEVSHNHSYWLRLHNRTKMGLVINNNFFLQLIIKFSLCQNPIQKLKSVYKNTKLKNNSTNLSYKKEKVKITAIKIVPKTVNKVKNPFKIVAFA